MGYFFNGLKKFFRTKDESDSTSTDLVSIEKIVKQPFTKPNNKNKSIDLSNAIYIELPKVETPKYDEERRSQEYWNYFNKGVSYYIRKQFHKAKDQFLNIVDQNPHNGLYDYLLRTYRKIYKKEIDEKKLNDAIKTLNEFFKVCKGYTTDTDRRNFNKVVDQLTKEGEEPSYQKFEIGKKTKIPNFELISPNIYSLKLIHEIDTTDSSYSNKKNWSYIEQVDNSAIIYVDSIYDPDKSCYSESILLARDSKGNILKEITLNHGIYHFKAAVNSDRFVVSTEDLSLFLYSTEGICLGTYDLKTYSYDKYHIRCIDISHNGQEILFTHIDKAYLMNSNFQIIESWRVPPKEGSEKSSSSTQKLSYEAYQQNLSLLGLSGEPTIDQIKSAFRRKIKGYHPDLNPSTTSSNEKTREIIYAYEELTSEDARKAFKGLEDEERYYQVVNKTKMDFNIPGTSYSFSVEFSLVFPGEDWIYSTCCGKRIYLGCYSGKTYSISKNGSPMEVYKCDEPVRYIREKNNHIYIETHNTLFIIKHDKYLTHIDKWKLGSGFFRWFDNGFLFEGVRHIKIFNNDGKVIGEIKFKNSIYDIFWPNKNMSVMTKNRTYHFQTD